MIPGQKPKRRKPDNTGLIICVSFGVIIALSMVIVLLGGT